VTTASPVVRPGTLWRPPTGAVPDLADVESVALFRRRWLDRDLTEQRFREAVDDLLALPFARFPGGPLMIRAYELRDNVTAYDASYVALAEALDATLLTADARLAAAPGINCSAAACRAACGPSAAPLPSTPSVIPSIPSHCRTDTSMIQQSVRLAAEPENTSSTWSGWGDSNSRPPAPKAGALTKLRHTPLARARPGPARRVPLTGSHPLSR
jgi:predicted nucleic acid-binding protein